MCVHLIDYFTHSSSHDTVNEFMHRSLVSGTIKRRDYYEPGLLGDGSKLKKLLKTFFQNKQAFSKTSF